jgi:hypothetical protein
MTTQVEPLRLMADSNQIRLSAWYSFIPLTPWLLVPIFITVLNGVYSLQGVIASTALLLILGYWVALAVARTRYNSSIIDLDDATLRLVLRSSAAEATTETDVSRATRVSLSMFRITPQLLVYIPSRTGFEEVVVFPLFGHNREECNRLYKAVLALKR